MRKIEILMACLLTSLGVQAVEINRIYLSGQDAATAVDWEFKISDGRNSGAWSTIPVPSNWEAEGFGYYLYGMDKMEKRNPTVGSYRKSFTFSPKPGHRYFLIFQGSMTDTTATLNGKKVGFHQGGYTEFNFEITDAVQEGKNLLEVEVDSSSSNASVVAAERYADFWLFGGIFRPVYIREVPDEFVDRVAIDAQMDGSINMDVFTDGVQGAKQIRAQVIDAQSNKVGSVFSAAISGDQTRLSAQLEGVQLWSHEIPNLYTVSVELMDGENVLHRYDEQFGFRTFEVRDHDGFYLNGKRLLLKGASMHSISPETGRTLSFPDMEDKVRWMKEMNFNCVRTHCYPPDAHFIDLCDEQGLMVIDEIGGWWKPYDLDVGPKIVKELVVRDVNHPSVVLWGNGNHKAHMPEFDEVFFKWDIQNRRPLKNESKSSNIFANYDPEFDIVNTTYYPGYEQLMERLFEENHIVMPNEVLHALYDGGGGANLKTYWDAFEKSKVGGGMMIWALFDEGLMRTDQGYTVDNQQNKAADGIIGPRGERKGSYYTAREVWSPVVISGDVVDVDFEGKLDVQNKFTHLNLNQCDVVWKLLNYANPDSANTGHRTTASGKVHVDDIPAGSTGTLSFDLPDELMNHDALSVEVRDAQGHLVHTKRMPIANDRTWFRTNQSRSFTQDPSGRKDVITFRRGPTALRFDAASGILTSVLNKNKPTSLGNFPSLEFEAADPDLKKDTAQSSRVHVSEKDGAFIIEAKDTKGFDSLKWTLQPNGEVVLDYAYTLPTGNYHYAGIGMHVAADDVLRKRWMGEGPARIWKNRTQGGLLDVYAVEKQINIPGTVYNPPEFEGCFAPWNWAVFYLENHLNIGFRNQSDVTLGVLNPVNGYNPKFAAWHYPKQEGFYFFDCISSVGSKWKPAADFGPDAQPTMMDQQIKGRVSMLINWNKPDRKAKRVDMEIE